MTSSTTHKTIPQRILDFANEDKETYINTTKLLRVMKGVTKEILHEYVTKLPSNSYGQDNGVVYFDLKTMCDFCKKVNYEFLSEYLLDLYALSFISSNVYEDYKFENKANMIKDTSMTRLNISALADISVDLIKYLTQKKQYMFEQYIMKR